ncbi:MAG: hypothetical protein J6Y28_09840 [Acholeplasmatales bacterium]|nr:hypothetical protein [Methanobrevibacter sp.]MBP5446460.1 hypothetical protein [Acholeplasmatales bacterium]
MRISKKYGVNPSILVCPICKDTAIALLGANGGKEAPRQMYGELCDECKKEYITILEIKDNKPTGNRGFIKREYINVKVKDFAYMESSEFNNLFKNSC